MAEVQLSIICIHINVRQRNNTWQVINKNGKVRALELNPDFNEPTPYAKTLQFVTKLGQLRD